MKCAQCQAENPAGMKFCGQCGSKLASPVRAVRRGEPSRVQVLRRVRLPDRGWAVPKVEEAAPSPAAPTASGPLGARPELHPRPPGPQVLQSRSALEGERKQVTVVFCDLVGSTALAERAGARDACTCCSTGSSSWPSSEVHRYEGTINQFLGDGFMALFGAPIAHEDHARRAALAALGLQKLLHEHRAELGPEHERRRSRCGWGSTPAGWWSAASAITLRCDYTADRGHHQPGGPAPALAEPGTILVSEDTSRFLQGAARARAPARPIQVKGKEAAGPRLPAPRDRRRAVRAGGAERHGALAVRRPAAGDGDPRGAARAGRGRGGAGGGDRGRGRRRQVAAGLRVPPPLLATARRASWPGAASPTRAASPTCRILHMLRNEWGIARDRRRRGRWPPRSRQPRGVGAGDRRRRSPTCSTCWGSARGPSGSRP